MSLLYIVGEHGQHRLHRVEGRHTSTRRCGWKPEFLGPESPSIQVGMCVIFIQVTFFSCIHCIEDGGLKKTKQRKLFSIL